jgi:phosphoglucosamine mutase
VGRLFGTDGIRGRVGQELTTDLAFDLGVAAVRVLAGSGASPPTILVGRDPRESGVELERALVAGIRKAGGNVVLAGIQPTPAVAFMTMDIGATAGVVISASHNPADDNGIKFFAANGMKLPDELEDEIERALHSPADPSQLPGELLPPKTEREHYMDHLQAASRARLDGMRVVLDCANGAASELAPEVLRRLGADVVLIAAQPDGRNINDGCGALFPEKLAAEVVRLRADAGVAHDGDADRAVFADAKGNIIDGDQVLAACAAVLHREGRLRGGVVVTTVMANLGFYHAMSDAGIRVITTQVGDRYVLEEMIRSDARLGGEQSGHIIFRDLATTGDGLLTAVWFLSLAAEQGQSVADLASMMRRFPQVLVNVEVSNRDLLEQTDEIWEAVRSSEDALGDRGRILVRASGTEPLVRVMVEAESEEVAREHATHIAKVVEASLS